MARQSFQTVMRQIDWQGQAIKVPQTSDQFQAQYKFGNPPFSLIGEANACLIRQVGQVVKLMRVGEPD